MSIQSEINRIKANVASAYSKLSAKGATMPTTQNTDNLASAIESIPGAEAMSIETIWEICGYNPSGLPSGYKLLNYIQSSGTQYVDTEFKPNQDTRVVIDMESVASHSDVPLFGARVAYKNTAFSLWLRDTKIQTDYNTLATTITVESTLKRFIIDKNKNVTTADGVTVTQTATTFQSAYSAYLFGLNQAGTLNSTGTVSIKLYSCQIYDNGTLVRDYVPCTDPSGAYGLYDKVNAKFYGNAGSGSFTGA